MCHFLPLLFRGFVSEPRDRSGRQYPGSTYTSSESKWNRHGIRTNPLTSVSNDCSGSHILLERSYTSMEVAQREAEPAPRSHHRLSVTDSHRAPRRSGG